MSKKDYKVPFPRIRGSVRRNLWFKHPPRDDGYVSPLDDGYTYPRRIAGGSDEDLKKETEISQRKTPEGDRRL